MLTTSMPFQGGVLTISPVLNEIALVHSNARAEVPSLWAG
jgi:hypothetical protein